MTSNNSIFAIATPQGKSGVAVIRISGDNAKQALQVFDVSKEITPRKALLAELKYEGELIDKALLFYFNSPHSFTGEDVIEIHCHGSRAVLKKIIEILGRQENFRTAEPGEFTKRAFLNAKMDLTAVEGLADLIDADTEAQRKQGLRIMQGDAANFYEKLRRDILHSLAYMEAYIDFPDEEIPEHVLQEIDNEIKSVISAIRIQLSDNRASEKIRDGIYVTILGTPNVGKSSLLNLLAKRDVAIVSDIAGTTRDVIEVALDIGGYSVIIADTAGIRENADIIEQEGIKRSFEKARTADIKIIMSDYQEIKNGNCATFDLIDNNSLLLINKCDLADNLLIPDIEGVSPIEISVKTQIGIDKFIDALQEKIAAIIPSEASFVTRQRHRNHLESALSHLNKCELVAHIGLEIKCEQLRRAAHEIGSITGKIAVDEILGHIFSSFCIGK